MKSKTNNYNSNRLSGCIKASLTGLFSLLLIFQVKAQNHWTPNIDEFDNYMTITAYIMFYGEELKSDKIEVGCFIDGECRGNYRLQAIEYMGHPYTCFLPVWGSSSDNGKEITFLLYNHETDSVFEAEEKPLYEYNGDLGSDNPYELTVKKTQEELDKEDVESVITDIENGVYDVEQATANDYVSVMDWLTKLLTDLLDQTGIDFQITITAINPAVAGTESNPLGTNGSFTFTVTLTKGTITLTTNEIHGVIVATSYTTTGLNNIQQTEPLKAWMQNGILHVSGLTSGKPWSVYNLAGMLLYRSIAKNNVETGHAPSLLQNCGIFIIQSDGRTEKIVTRDE